MENFSREKFFFKVRNTTLEMLEDRKFKINDEDKNLPFNEFAHMLDENKIDIVAEKISDPNTMIYVYFLLENISFSKKDLDKLKNFIDETFPDKDMNVIVVVQDKPTPQIAKELQLDEYKNYEIFLAKNLMFNITKHNLVPKHVLLTEEESKEVLDRFLATKSQLPRLLSTDPVARYYGMKSGDICKIIRNSPMTGETYYYRLVK